MRLWRCWSGWQPSTAKNGRRLDANSNNFGGALDFGVLQKMMDNLSPKYREPAATEFSMHPMDAESVIVMHSSAFDGLHHMERRNLTITLYGLRMRRARYGATKKELRRIDHAEVARIRLFAKKFVETNKRNPDVAVEELLFPDGR